VTAWLDPARWVDVILGLVVLEAMALLVYRRLTGRGIAPADLLPNLAAGASLLVALRAGLAGAGAGWIALWLAVALAAHLADLRRRWVD
jgi:hypothetical protein